jgi:hypothetical protein
VLRAILGVCNRDARIAGRTHGAVKFGRELPRHRSFAMNFRSKNFLFLLVGAFAALGIFFYGSFESKTEIISCDLRGCISESKLLANISEALKANAVGYVAVVDNLFVAHDGWGRTSADPPTAGMTTVLTGNIASVTKTLTTIAVLQLLASKELTIDSKMSPYLYGDW